ncbi:MAG TPA: aldo/keto reductase [Bryobacteraceae bacterium]|nr:aldo/keto reductase [Bryobacteraceae bacterium]
MSMIAHRKLGSSGLEVPVITLGGNVFGWTVSESDTFGLLDRAVDLGLTFIDTADLYSRWVPGHKGGESETLIGKWLAKSGKRDRVTIATKVGMDMGEAGKGLSAKHIAQSAEASLRRLQTDRIDLYFSHLDDQETPLGETLTAHEKLLREGKVRAVGASNYKGARLREAMKTKAIYTVLQPHYNLVERPDYETDLAPVVADYGLGVVPYFALASGFLSGKYRSAKDAEGKARGGAVGKYLNDRGFAVLAALDAAAKEHSSTPARVALAWLIAQPGITSPIASATNEVQLADLAEAANLKLSKDSIQKLNQASA